MLVVDASCLCEVVMGGPGAEAIREKLITDADHAAPHIVDVEVFDVIRREHLRGRWTARRLPRRSKTLKPGPVSASDTRPCSPGPGSCATPFAGGAPCM